MGLWDPPRPLPKPICRWCERDIVFVSVQTSELAAWNDRQCGAPRGEGRWRHVDGPAICVETWRDEGVQGTFAEPNLWWLKQAREFGKP